MLKFLSMSVSIFTLLLWTQTQDQWVLVTSMIWLLVFAFADDIIDFHRKKKQ